MQLDYHYYTIYKLAELAGFKRKDRGIIAYASQYVDDSTESEPVQAYKDQVFDTVRTSHIGLEAFHWNVQKKVYMPFHFLPNCIRRLSPDRFSYITRPATGKKNELATMLVNNAISDTNKKQRLIRIGIALHSIADTFSHFNFSGRQNKENIVGIVWHKKNEGGWKLKIYESVADIFLPEIGHVKAFMNPDLPFLEWRYTNYEDKKVRRKNLRHCLEGANVIYRFLLKVKGTLSPSSSIATDHPKEYRRIEKLFNKNAELKKRCDAWAAYANSPRYDKTKWRKEAIEGDTKWDDMSRSRMKEHLRRLKGKPGFDESNWAGFHRAAQKQRSLVLEWIN
jgi:hypothetical protein